MTMTINLFDFNHLNTIILLRENKAEKQFYIILLLSYTKGIKLYTYIYREIL